MEESKKIQAEEIVKTFGKGGGWFEDYLGSPHKSFSTRAHAYGRRDKPGEEDIKNANRLEEEFVRAGFKVVKSQSDEFVTLTVI